MLTKMDELVLKTGQVLLHPSACVALMDAKSRVYQMNTANHQ